MDLDDSTASEARTDQNVLPPFSTFYRKLDIFCTNTNPVITETEQHKHMNDT